MLAPIYHDKCVMSAEQFRYIAHNLMFDSPHIMMHQFNGCICIFSGCLENSKPTQVLFKSAFFFLRIFFKKRIGAAFIWGNFKLP